MTIRKFIKTDYKTVCDWWKKHNFPPVPYDYLPKNGFIIPKICAAWLYKTDSAFAMIEWVISDPESNPEERDTALDLLIRSLIGQAKKLGYQSIFISTAGKNWIERLKQHGFVNSQENMANLVLNI